MTAGVVLAERAGPGFELEFVDAAGERRCEPLSVCWSVGFEHGRPVRSFRWGKGQRHFPGWWWSASTGSHVGFESWLERDRVMLLDFDPAVTAIASQPFWLHWSAGDGGRRHAPDFFVRRCDGSAEVIDVRADDRIGPEDEAAFDAAGAACGQVGWGFRRLGEPDRVLAGNVRWLSRYRHPRCGARSDVAEGLVEAFSGTRPLFEGAAVVGDRLVVLPVLFHLLWHQVLTADLRSELLGPVSLVCARGREG